MSNVFRIGRVIPLYGGAWDNTKTYENFTKVKYNNNTYISKKDVPIGTSIENTEFWELEYNSNLRIEEVAGMYENLNEDVKKLKESYNDTVESINNECKKTIKNTFDIEQDMYVMGDFYVGSNENEPEKVKSNMRNLINEGMSSCLIACLLKLNYNDFTVTKDINDSDLIEYLEIVKDLEFKCVSFHYTFGNDEGNNISIMNSLKDVITSYAPLLEKYGINMVCLTNENPNATNNTSLVSYWQDIINTFKTYYTGIVTMTYTTDQMYNSCISGYLDVLCVNEYPRLCSNEVYNVDDIILSNWNDEMINLKYFADKYNKDIYITEIGCFERQGALAAPGYCTADTIKDQTIQYKYFNLTLPLLKSQKWLKGFGIWNFNKPGNGFYPLGTISEEIVLKYIKEGK